MPRSSSGSAPRRHTHAQPLRRGQAAPLPPANGGQWDALTRELAALLHNPAALARLVATPAPGAGVAGAAGTADEA